MAINLPNSITLIRIIFIPLFVVLFYSPLRYGKLLSTAVFLLLSLTDFIDGYLARKRKQETDVGKILDPIADKLLIATALILLIGRGAELWMALIIIIREALLTAIRLLIVGQNVVVAASWLGKLKTISQIIAITAALLGFPFAYWLMLIAVILTLISGIDYLIAIKRMTGNKIINIPNTITFIRLILIIPFVLFVRQNEISSAIVCFVTIALLDRVDGFFARIAKQRTKVGEIFDTLADWIIILVSLLTGILLGYISGAIIWIAGVSIAITSAAKLIYFKRKEDSASTLLGKITIGMAYLTVISYLIPLSYKEYVGWATIASSAATTLYFLIKAFRNSS